MIVVVVVGAWLIGIALIAMMFRGAGAAARRQAPGLPPGPVGVGMRRPTPAGESLRSTIPANENDSRRRSRSAGYPTPRPSGL